ncbi:hypothetical protein GCM10009755_11460 [Brevibacterium samyangense]|uniref:Uncharacterized protein n=1 Tax=Brevibacterium samyangense TaxID=366888 RepID=A0ABP5EP19_9MICO
MAVARALLPGSRTTADGGRGGIGRRDEADPARQGRCDGRYGDVRHGRGTADEQEDGSPATGTGRVAGSVRDHESVRDHGSVRDHEPVQGNESVRAPASIRARESADG